MASFGVIPSLLSCHSMSRSIAARSNSPFAAFPDTIWRASLLNSSRKMATWARRRSCLAVRRFISLLSAAAGSFGGTIGLASRLGSWGHSDAAGLLSRGGLPSPESGRASLLSICKLINADIHGWMSWGGQALPISFMARLHVLWKR